MEKVRIGIIGAGKMALWHIRAYRKIPSVEIVAIANPFSNRGVKLAKKYGIPEHFKDGFELIDKADIDAVDVSVPTKLHKDFILKALHRGLHIYSEKPMCTAEKDYEEIIGANKNAKRIIFNGFNYRFLPEFCRIHSIIMSGRLGNIRYVRMLRTTREKPDSYIFSDSGSGIFNEFQCHFVDLLYYFGFDKPEKVYASGTIVDDCEINPDTSTTVLSYPDKMLAEITTSFASPAVTPEVMMMGTRATLRLRFGRVSIIKKDIYKLPELILLLFRDSITIPIRVLKNPFYGSCKHFIKCILDNKKSECDELSALKTFRITAAAELSYRKGVPVMISELN